MKLGQVIKLPTKTRRKYYSNKLFSLNSVVEISRISIGVLLAESFLLVIKRVF